MYLVKVLHRRRYLVLVWLIWKSRTSRGQTVAATVSLTRAVRIVGAWMRNFELTRNVHGYSEECAADVILTGQRNDDELLGVLHKLEGAMLVP